MNVACPQCSTVYRIDPAAVPEAGAGTQCRECGSGFRVERARTEPAGAVSTAAPLEDGAVVAADAPGHDAESHAVASQEAQAAEGETSDGRAAETGGAPGTAGPVAPAFGPQDPETRAKRLARALVSDITVYNPDRWERSREAGTLRKDFRDEILKSWEEYVEQVGEEMAKKRPYFRDALNDILARGKSIF